MKKTLILFFLVIASVMSPVLNAEQKSEEQLAAEAMQIVQQFSGLLKPKLKEAIQLGGFTQAIKVCSVEAPKIAKELSDATGWSVKRVSLKTRNKASAVPDSFERAVLLQFNERQAAGELASAITFSSIEDTQFRFMRAQGTEALCLGCHGSSISDDVKKALNMHYPEDTATGYSLGQIRGAFSLTKNLSE